MTRYETLEDGSSVEMTADGQVVIHCHRCGGRGYIEGYRHIGGGICFECNGHGGRALVSLAEEQRKAHARVLARARSEKKRAAEQAKKDAEKAAWHSALSEDASKALARLESDDPDDGAGFLGSLNYSLRRYGKLTDAQIAALVASYVKDDAFASAPAVSAPSGRVVVTGVVLKICEPVTSYFGYRETVTYRMIVKSDDGYRVLLTVPSDISDVARGERISVTVTLTPSDDDKSFAFGKRPAKATVLASCASV